MLLYIRIFTTCKCPVYVYIYTCIYVYIYMYFYMNFMDYEIVTYGNLVKHGSRGGGICSDGS